MPITEDSQIGNVTKISPYDSSTFEVTFSEDKESWSAKERPDDSADESIISARIAENATLNRIEKLGKHPTISL